METKHSHRIKSSLTLSTIFSLINEHISKDTYAFRNVFTKIIHLLAKHTSLLRWEIRKITCIRFSQRQELSGLQFTSCVEFINSLNLHLSYMLMWSSTIPQSAYMINFHDLFIKVPTRNTKNNKREIFQGGIIHKVIIYKCVDITTKTYESGSQGSIAVELLLLG